MARGQPPGAPQNVFRTLYNAVAIATKEIIEITNPAASGVTLHIRDVKFYSLLANQFKVNRNSTAVTGGTSSAPAVLRSRPDSVPAATLKHFTVASTGGGALDALWDILENIAAQTIRAAPLTESETGLIIPPGYFCTIGCSVATQTEGYVEWTEEPV